MERTNLLTLLASLPPEQLVEGAQVTVTRVDGTEVTITMGSRIPAQDPLIA